MPQFYDGNKLMSLKDINGNVPEIRLCVSNRLAGKSTYYYRWAVNRFLRNKQKTVFIYRWQNEIDTCAQTIDKTARSLFFPNIKFTQDTGSKDKFAYIQANGKNMGYAVAINSADAIRKISGIFYDSTAWFFDEFQPESNKYCPGEITKFISLHTSLARGGGEQVRFFPGVMCSNAVSLLNPYYNALGINKRIRSKDHYIRGNGFVMEQLYSEDAANNLKNSGFMQAFGNHSYTKFAAENKYLLDNVSFVTNYSGKKQYYFTLVDDEWYAVYLTPQGIYVNHEVDKDYPTRIATSTDTLTDYCSLKSAYAPLISHMRHYFNHAMMCFKDAACRNAALNLMSY